MKIRSLLLGSLALAGLSTAGYAADLGVVTSLDVCDELGLSGLTISSDDNCLQISGNVSVELAYGDWEDSVAYQTFDRTLGTKKYMEGDGTEQTKVDIDTWLKFVGTSSTDFGPASATIKLLSEDYDGIKTFSFAIDEAWVGIGDTTVIMAGKKSSIFNDGNDAPLNYLGLFNSENVDSGVGFKTAGAKTGGVVLQATTNLGNGITLSGGIENWTTVQPAALTAVGVLAYAGDGIAAHVSGAFDANSDWKLHAGFQGTWDPITVVGAVAADDTGWWNALGSVSATFDIFTLAASVEGTSAGELGAGGSVAAKVNDMITVNAGARIFEGVAATNYDAELGISAALTETITLTAAVGAADSDAAGAAGFVYGKAGLAWAPGGGFTASVAGEANSLGAYKATFKAAKSIK